MPEIESQISTDKNKCNTMFTMLISNFFFFFFYIHRDINIIMREKNNNFYLVKAFLRNENILTLRLKKLSKSNKNYIPTQIR